MAKNKKNRLLNFFKDVKGELKKVTWPSFKQVRNNTIIVIVSVLIIGAFIWIWDALLGFAWGKITDSQSPAEQIEQTTNTEGTQQTETSTENNPQ